MRHNPRIADIRATIVGGDRWGWVVVTIVSENGTMGYGEASLEGREQSVVQAVLELRRYLLGQNAFDLSRHIFAMFREPIWSGGPILQCAISGLEMALWDLKGKYLQAPVYELLGGRMRDDLRLYSNGWWYRGGSPDDVAWAAKSVMEQGFFGLKFNPFNRQPLCEPFYLDARVLGRGVEYVAAVREAVGKDVDLYLDFNAIFMNTGDVLRCIEAVEPFNIGFIEEPIAQENYEAMAELRRKSRIPIATGERLFTTFEFHNLLRAGATDIAQPDLCHCGGIQAGLKVAHMAEAAYVPIAPHNPNGPFCETASAHLGMTATNFLILEHFEPEPWREGVIGTPFKIRDGRLMVNDEPGFGIRFNEEEAAKHPFTVKDLRDFHSRNFAG